VWQVLHEELSGLPERYRAPLVLCYLEGATQEEAAGMVGVAKSTLRERLERGRALLRTRLVRRGLGPAAVLVAAAWPAASASAGVPLLLIVSTLKAASLFPAGDAAVTGLVSARVAASAQGVLKAMLLNKLKAGVAVVLLLGFLLTGATVLVLPPIRQVAHAVPLPAERPKGPNRILAFRAGHVALLDPAGKNDRKVAPLPKYIQRARLSPDGKKIAALILTPSKEPQLNKTEDGDFKMLSTLHVRGLEENEPWTSLEVECQSFAWSPDGTQIACSDCKNGFASMDFAGLDPKSFAARNPKSPEATHFVLNVATKKQTALKLSEKSADHIITDWSQDGKYFLTTSVHGPDGGRCTRLNLMNRDGTEPRALTDGKEPAMYGRLSPDGKRVLYRTLTAAPEENRPAKLGLVLAVRDIASGKVARVEESGGDVYSFCWSPDAKRIAYTWRQTHEGTREDVIDKETEAYMVLCDPDGKNRKTITTVKGRGPTPGPRLWDWR